MQSDTCNPLLLTVGYPSLVPTTNGVQSDTCNKEPLPMHIDHALDPTTNGVQSVTCNMACERRSHAATLPTTNGVQSVTCNHSTTGFFL